MRRRISPNKATFEISLFRKLHDDELDAVRAAADRYGTFLGVDATVAAVT